MWPVAEKQRCLSTDEIPDLGQSPCVREALEKAVAVQRTPCRHRGPFRSGGREHCAQSAVLAPRGTHLPGRVPPLRNQSGPCGPREVAQLSISKPLGRSLLYIEAVIETCVWLTLHRAGDPAGLAAAAWLREVDEEELLLAALCADGSDEVVAFLRHFDQEALPQDALQHPAPAHY